MLRDGENTIFYPPFSIHTIIIHNLYISKYCNIILQIGVFKETHENVCITEKLSILVKSVINNVNYRNNFAKYKHLAQHSAKKMYIFGEYLKISYRLSCSSDFLIKLESKQTKTGFGKKWEIERSQKWKINSFLVFALCSLAFRRWSCKQIRSRA